MLGETELVGADTVQAWRARFASHLRQSLRDFPDNWYLRQRTIQTSIWQFTDTIPTDCVEGPTTATQTENGVRAVISCSVTRSVASAV
jgi:hypothetical protein